MDEPDLVVFLKVAPVRTAIALVGSIARRWRLALVIELPRQSFQIALFAVSGFLALELTTEGSPSGSQHFTLVYVLSSRWTWLPELTAATPSLTYFSRLVFYQTFWAVYVLALLERAYKKWAALLNGHRRPRSRQSPPSTNLHYVE